MKFCARHTQYIVWPYVPFLRCLSQRPGAKMFRISKMVPFGENLKIIRIFARVLRDKMRFPTRVFEFKSGKIIRVFWNFGAKCDTPGLGQNVSGNVRIGQNWSGHTNNTQWYSRQMYRNRTVTHNFVSISLCVYLPSKKFQSELPIQTENQLNWRRTILRVSIENE